MGRGQRRRKKELWLCERQKGKKAREDGSEEGLKGGESFFLQMDEVFDDL
jgi:hypothetical protein